MGFGKGSVSTPGGAGWARGSWILARSRPGPKQAPGSGAVLLRARGTTSNVFAPKGGVVGSLAPGRLVRRRHCLFGLQEGREAAGSRENPATAGDGCSRRRWV